MKSILQIVYNDRDAMLHSLRPASLVIAVAAACAFASPDMPRDMPIGMFRGTMVGFEGTPALGQLLASGPDGEVFQCGYDAHSYLEFQRARITVAKLEPGDPLEILADNPPGTTVCYVRIVHVVAPPSPRALRRAEEARVTKRIDSLSRGNVSISGVVTRTDGNLLTLRTREGEETVRLRRDTRYFGDGLSRERGSLAVHMRVAVRAGRNLDGSLDAYQISWGSIVTVR